MHFFKCKKINIIKVKKIGDGLNGHFNIGKRSRGTLRLHIFIGLIKWNHSLLPTNHHDDHNLFS